MANDDRRNQQGKTGSWLYNPWTAAAAVWGAAIGIAGTVLGIRRLTRGTETEKAAGPLPERPETSAGIQPQPGPGGRPPRQRASSSKPEPSTKAAPAKATGRRSAAERQTTRRGARPAAPVKQGAAAKIPGVSDKGGAQRPAGQRSRAAPAPAGSRAGTRSPATTPRPKASEKHPAQPRPGQAAREEPPVSGGPPAMAPATGVTPQRPPALGAPRGGKADDLKQITGVGPKLEEKLNGLGIYHYEQIAGWGDSDIAWIDAELQARGRVERDNWVGQAAALMAGAKPTGQGPAA